MRTLVLSSIAAAGLLWEAAAGAATITVPGVYDLAPTTDVQVIEIEYDIPGPYQGEEGGLFNFDTPDAWLLGNIEIISSNALSNVPGVQDTSSVNGALDTQARIDANARAFLPEPGFALISLNFNVTLYEADNPQPPVVPAPAALPLLTTAIAGLGYAGWKRRRTAG